MARRRRRGRYLTSRSLYVVGAEVPLYADLMDDFSRLGTAGVSSRAPSAGMPGIGAVTPAPHYATIYTG